jgi:hypothetical protein
LKQFTEKTALFNAAFLIIVFRFGRLSRIVMLIDEQLNQHVARLAPSSGAAGLGDLFYFLQIPFSDMGLNSFVRNLKTLTDDFFIRVGR